MNRPTNPYLQMSLVELSDAAEQLAGDLLKPRQRTAAERAALAQRCGFLLIALGRTIRPGYYRELAPEYRCEPAGGFQSFSDWFGREQVALRSIVLRRALDFSGRSLDTPLPPEAFSSDAGTRESLSAIFQGEEGGAGDWDCAGDGQQLTGDSK